jgi:diaminopimelate epimerase
VRFVKIEGAGNDYVLVETFSQRVDQPAQLARLVSDRHVGIGSDGLILVGPPDSSAGSAAHARMRIFNADGSEGRMCGNGLRCVVRWLVEQGRAPAAGALVQTASGPRRGQPLSDGRWEIELGEPDFTARALGLPGAETEDARLPLPPGLHGDPPLAFGVSVGNLHLVLRVAAPESEDLRAAGETLGALVPGGANVHLLALRGEDELFARPWELGSGATQACGTGAVACAVVARRQGWLAADTVRVRMPGGELRVRWSGAGAAWLAGPARIPFHGEWPEP